MSSIINAGTSGVTITGSTSTVLSLATNGTTRLNIDASGNLAVGTGNLTFSSTAQRITGDMSNATIANRLAFQTTTANSQTTLHVLPNGSATSSGISFEGDSATTNGTTFQFLNNPGGGGDARINAGIRGTGTYLPMTFYTGGSERMRLDTSGNLGLGTTPSFLFDAYNSSTAVDYVAGRFYSAAAASGESRTWLKLEKAVNYGGAVGGYLSQGVGSGLIFGTQNNASTPTERMRIDNNGNVGIGGTASSFSKFEVTGTLPTSSNTTQTIRQSGTLPSGSTSQSYGYVNVLNTAAASFTCAGYSHYFAFQSALGAGSAVTNQFGFLVSSTLIGATNNYGFYSDIASGSNRWNFYAAGTARNYFAGRTDVGNTRISEANVWNGVSIDSTSTVTLTSGSSVNLSSSVCGGAIISVYVTGSGNGGLFWANYSATVTKLVGNGEATDTGSDFAVYKNAASHTTTLKNKSASTQVFAVSILSGTLS